MSAPVEDSDRAELDALRAVALGTDALPRRRAAARAWLDLARALGLIAHIVEDGRGGRRHVEPDPASGTEADAWRWAASEMAMVVLTLDSYA